MISYSEQLALDDIYSLLTMKANFDSEEFWRQNWQIIKYMDVLSMVLLGAIEDFKQRKDYREAVALISISNSALQLIRNFAAIEGKNINSFVQDYEDRKETFNELKRKFSIENTSGTLLESLDPDIDREIAESLDWLFDLSSFIRHPNLKKFCDDNLNIFSDHWIESNSDKLLKSCCCLSYLYDRVHDHFDDSGWIDEIQRKRALKLKMEVKS